MARRLQELFGDLADEDFLSAVQDAENRFAPPSSSSSSSEPGGGSQAAAPPSWDVAPPQDELATDWLLLAACAELEGGEGPGGARKKPRLGAETPPPQPGGRPPLPPPTAGPGPRLALRPTAAGGGPPRTPPAPMGPPPQNTGQRPPPAQPPRAPAAPREGAVGKEPPPQEPPPGGLPTPLVTNHLVQLVAAASRAPPAPPRLPPRGKTRRFPGPAGILPQQHAGKLLEHVLIAAPTAPAHGAVAKVRVEELPSSPQPPEEDFGRGPWLAKDGAGAGRAGPRLLPPHLQRGHGAAQGGVAAAPQEQGAQHGRDAQEPHQDQRRRRRRLQGPHGGDAGHGASPAAGGEAGPAEARRGAAAAAGGGLLPVPPQPLPQRHPRQPAQDLPARARGL